MAIRWSAIVGACLVFAACGAKDEADSGESTSDASASTADTSDSGAETSSGDASTGETGAQMCPPDANQTCGTMLNEFLGACQQENCTQPSACEAAACGLTCVVDGNELFEECWSGLCPDEPPPFDGDCQAACALAAMACFEQEMSEQGDACDPTTSSCNDAFMACQAPCLNGSTVLTFETHLGWQ